MLLYRNATTDWMKPWYFFPYYRGIRKIVSQENSVNYASIYNKHMLYETNVSTASVQTYALQTGLHQVSKVYIALQNFLEYNLGWFPRWSASTKINQISSSRWWRFVTATSAIPRSPNHQTTVLICLKCTFSELLYSCKSAMSYINPCCISHAH